MHSFSWKVLLACSLLIPVAAIADTPAAKSTPSTPAPEVGPASTATPAPPVKPAPPGPPAAQPIPPAPPAPPPPAAEEPAHAVNPASVVRKSLVRITVTSQDANYRVPWFPGNTGGGVGAGFVIDGDRVMTNAHVISNARFITVEKDNDPKKYIGHVEFVGHDCDLAVVKIEDGDQKDFFKGTIPLQFGGIPEIESTVTVYGYPIGGERMSVTNGIVSRIDFQTYTHSGVDAHLTIQTSAPINPGNSGGPVLQDGKVIGVAFQGYSGDVAQNTGYMIPTPVMKRFLKDIESGHYNKYMDLSVTTFELQNPAMRRALGLPDDDQGVMVGTVASAGSSDGILKTGDVLLSIDGHADRERRVRGTRRRAGAHGGNRRAQIQGRQGGPTHPARQEGDGCDRAPQRGVALSACRQTPTMCFPAMCFSADCSSSRSRTISWRKTELMTCACVSSMTTSSRMKFTTSIRRWSS